MGPVSAASPANVYSSSPGQSTETDMKAGSSHSGAKVQSADPEAEGNIPGKKMAEYQTQTITPQVVFNADKQELPAVNGANTTASAATESTDRSVSDFYIKQQLFPGSNTIMEITSDETRLYIGTGKPGSSHNVKSVSIYGTSPDGKEVDIKGVPVNGRYDLHLSNGRYEQLAFRKMSNMLSRNNPSLGYEVPIISETRDDKIKYFIDLKLNPSFRLLAFLKTDNQDALPEKSAEKLDESVEKQPEKPSEEPVVLTLNRISNIPKEAPGPVQTYEKPPGKPTATTGSDAKKTTAAMKDPMGRIEVPDAPGWDKTANTRKATQQSDTTGFRLSRITNYFRSKREKTNTSDG